ncbi:transposase [Xanthomonas theicola]|nr:transposase [Xanthomonas theicola]
MEGLNNKIRVIQRSGYGDRDEDYLKLKIIAGFLPPLPDHAPLHPHRSAKTPKEAPQQRGLCQKTPGSTQSRVQTIELAANSLTCCASTGTRGADEELLVAIAAISAATSLEATVLSLNCRYST